MTEVEASAADRSIANERDRPRLHIHPEHGWLNDPNGLCRIDGTYHVFYQHNPDGPMHENIHWAHASSPDLLTWTTQPIALSPQPGGADRGGCWSGCIVDDHGVPTALYTGVADSPENAGVMLSRSDRTLRDWRNDDHWQVGVPDDPRITQVRDPFAFTFNGHRYAVQGAGGVGQSPQLLLYGCDDLTDWRYLGPLLTTADPVAATAAEANVWECPSLFQLGDTWVLLLSLWRDEVLSGVRYLVGDLSRDGDGLRYSARSGGTLDAGPTFYAPQALVEAERVLLWGWAWEGADRRPAETAAAGWAGTLTSPREVVLRDDQVRLEPATELLGLRREQLAYVSGDALRIDAFEVFAAAGLRLLLVDPLSGQRSIVAESHGPTHLFVDGSLVEVYGTGPSFTTRAYPGADRRWVVESRGQLEVWRLGLPG